MARPSLWLLAPLVLATHLALLLQWPAHPLPPPEAIAPVFSTRMLAPPAPEPRAEPPVAAAERQAPRAKPRSTPKRRSAAAPQRAPAPAAAPPPPKTPPPAVPLAGIDPTIGTLHGSPAQDEANAGAPGDAPAMPIPATSDPTVSPTPSDASEPADTAAQSAVSAPPVLLPPSTTLEFGVSGQAKGFQYRASAQLQWRQEGSRYEARQKISAFLLGSRVQSSSGRITTQGLEPERFVDQARRERSAEFDHSAHEARFSGQPQSEPMAPGAQDRLSMFIQLGALLAAAPERYPAGTQIAMTTMNTRHAEAWVFVVEGAEDLDLPAGKVPTLKLQRLPRPGHNGEQKAELWLGTQLHYLPVRIRLSESNGDYADLLLEEHTTP